MAEKIEANSGNYAVLKHLAGSNSTSAKAKSKETPRAKCETIHEEDPAWMEDMQRQWLSIHNPLLFEPLIGG